MEVIDRETERWVDGSYFWDWKRDKWEIIGVFTVLIVGMSGLGNISSNYICL